MVSFIAIHFAYSKVKSKFLRNESMSKQNNFEMKLQEKAENLKFNFLWNLLHNNSNPYVVNSNSKKKKKKKKKKKEKAWFSLNVLQMFLLLCLKVILSLIAKRGFILIKNNFNFSPIPLVLKNILFAKFDEKNIQQSFLVQKL